MIFFRYHLDLNIFQVLNRWIESSEEKKEDDVAEVQELLDVLEETIAAVKAELKDGLPKVLIF